MSCHCTAGRVLHQKSYQKIQTSQVMCIICHPCEVHCHYMLALSLTQVSTPYLVFTDAEGACLCVPHRPSMPYPLEKYQGDFTNM